MKKVLVVVDYQVDFVTGALANPLAMPLETGIVAKIEQTLAEGGKVLFTKDTHTAEYLTTREGMYLPVPHCIKGTDGWRLQGALAQYETSENENIAIVEKATFGDLAVPKAVEMLCDGAPDEIELCGVVTDICVVSNAILLHSAFHASKVSVYQNLTASTTHAGQARALDLLAGMGYGIVEA